VDPLELLELTGRVERADPEVLEHAATTFLASARSQHAGAGRAARRSERGNRVAAPWSSGRGAHGTLRRRRHLVWLTAGATVMAAVAAGVSLTLTPRPPGSEARARAAGGISSATMPRGASLGSAILTAFDAHAADILVFSKQATGGGAADGRTVVWLSPAESSPGELQHYRRLSLAANGTPRTDLEMSYTTPAARPFAATPDNCAEVFTPPRSTLASTSGGIRGQATAVSYGLKQWSKGQVNITAAQFVGAAQLQTCLRAGRWDVAGRSDLNGRRVVRLVQPGGMESLWLNARTYLPVRLVARTPSGETLTFDYRFLPPTAANLADLTPVIPPGFMSNGD
jgi:hypothetical protein